MGIESWSTSAGSNNMAPPAGWPGGMLPSQVEPTGRQMMASLATWYQAAEWINYNFPIVYSSGTVFTISTNVTALYHVGRRVQATDGSTSVFGTITASAFTSITTVTVVWDTGVLQTGVTIVYVGITSKVNTSAPSQATSFANPSATIGLSAVNGVATTAMASDSAPPLSQAISPTWSGTHTFTNPVTVNGAGTSLKGGVTITTPTSGASLTLNGIAASAQSLLNLLGGTNGSASILLEDGQSGTRQWIIEAGNPAVGNLRVRDATRAADVMVLNNVGGISVLAPASGVAFSATGIASQYAGLFTGGGAAGAQKGLSAVTTTQNAADKIFNVNNSISNLLDIFGDGHGDLGPNLSWTVAGNFTIAVPTSGIPLTVTSNDNATAILVNDASASSGIAALTVENSGTVRGQIGTGSAVQTGASLGDFCLVANTGTLRFGNGTTSFMTVSSTGVVSGNDGTNLFELGYKDIPQNLQTASYQLVLADRGKSILLTTNNTLTLTIPANASVAFPIGTTIVVATGSNTGCTVAITTDNLILAGAGTTGTRSLSAFALATLYKVNATSWLISGSGVS